MTKIVIEETTESTANLAKAKSTIQVKSKQKRVKLDNGKTVIVDVPAKDNGKDPFKEVAGLLRGVKNLQPCD